MHSKVIWYFRRRRFKLTRMRYKNIRYFFIGLLSIKYKLLPRSSMYTSKTMQKVNNDDDSAILFAEKFSSGNWFYFLNCCHRIVSELIDFHWVETQGHINRNRVIYGYLEVSSKSKLKSTHYQHSLDSLALSQYNLM